MITSTFLLIQNVNRIVFHALKRCHLSEFTFPLTKYMIILLTQTTGPSKICKLDIRVSNTYY